MIIIKILILYFIQIRHTDDFPSTATRLVLNNNVSYFSESLSFACCLAFACISHASSGLEVPNPRRLRPEDACEMHAKASQQAKLKDSENYYIFKSKKRII